MVVGRATRERVRMEPTRELISFHSMKRGGVCMSDGMIISGVTTVVGRQITTGVEIQDAGCIVKETPGRQALLDQPTVLY